MGLWDKQATVYTPQQAAANAGRMLTRALDPIAESFGYQSEEKQVMNIMKDVDMSDPESFTDGFNAIMQISPEAANEFKVQGMPILEANLSSRRIAQTDRQLDQTDATLAFKEKELTDKQTDDQSKNWSIQTVGNPDDPTQTITIRVNKVTGDSHPILDTNSAKYIKEIFAEQNPDTGIQKRFDNILKSYKAIERDYGTTFCKFSADGLLEYSSCKPNKNTDFKDELPTLEEYFRSKSTGGNIYDTIQQTIVGINFTSDVGQSIETSESFVHPEGAKKGNHTNPDGTVIKVWLYPDGTYHSEDGTLIG